jgi:hypothetical protein
MSQLLRLHESMAGHKSSSRARCPFAHRLAGETDIRLTSTLERAEWPDFVFAFHDDEEIGPRMLARISKRTGLTPDDL